MKEALDDGQNGSRLDASRGSAAGPVTDAATPTDRLFAFSDGLFAIIITVLVLELRPPETPTLAALGHLWPVGLSYAVSFFFIAIVWVNHHHLLRFASGATPRLIWINFAHLFSVTLIPFTTAWLGESRVAGLAVTVYAAVFMLVNVTYVALCWEAVDRSPGEAVSRRVGALWRMRSVTTLLIFGVAGLLALRYPYAGMALITLCLLFYTRPDRAVR